MPIEISETRRLLLTELEAIIGQEFYNPRIRNYGPGGVREPDGRELRYPVTFQLADGSNVKSKAVWNAAVPTDRFLTGHYVLGTNQLDIMLALHKLLEHLETRYGVKLGAAGYDAKSNVT